MDFGGTRKRAPLVLELTPLIDVVFLLLIFFMVSTTFVSQPAGMQIELPRSQNRDVLLEGEDLTIHLAADGKVFVDEEPVSQDQLRSRLTAAAKADPSTLVIIRADTKLAHGRVVQAMDLARDVGLTDFAIATEDGGAAGGGGGAGGDLR